MPNVSRRRHLIAAAATVLIAGVASVITAPAAAAAPVTCFGQTPTHLGTSGPDELTGTVGPDVIYGGAGDDIINGLGSNDRICGGLGADRILGGNGADVVAGGGGNDYVDGGAGNDTIDGGTEKDNCLGEIKKNCEAATLNRAPVANGDEPQSLLEDGSLVVAAPGVLGNDTDPDGDTITASLVAIPTFGSAFTFSANGSFSYTPVADYCGSDSFTYRASDGVAPSSVATVSLNVTCVNDAPSFTSGGNVTANAGTAYSQAWATNLSAGPSDESAQTLSFTITGNDQPGFFTVAPAIASDGTLSFTPTSAAKGTATISAELSDNGGTANLGDDTTAFSFMITIPNSAPVANGDSYSTLPFVPLTVSAAGGVLSNDSDPNGDPLTASLVTTPAKGTLTLNADGSFTYFYTAPTCVEVDFDSFTYRANDGTTNSASATVGVTIICPT